MNDYGLLGLIRKRRRRAFNAWQVELTTRCPLRCTMCIRSGAKDWPSLDMPFDDFRRLVPWFSQVRAVVLEGWGEPLLYPDLTEAVRLVKSAGAEAGFVTSGKGLSEDLARDLVDSGLDFIGFSLAGATAPTHNAIRVGSDLDELLQTIRRLFRLRSEMGCRNPRIHVTYLMLRENIAEVPGLMSLVHELGITNVILLNRVALTSDTRQADGVFDAAESKEYDAILNEAAVRAAQKGVYVSRPSLLPSELAVCDENPLTNVYVSATGQVSPCVYLNPPAGGQSHALRVTYGNVLHGENTAGFLESGAYRSFQHLFTRRKAALDAIYARLGGMGMDFPPTHDLLPPPPDPCKKCYKLFGA